MLARVVRKGKLGFTVLRYYFFSCGISEILILMNSIAVSSSPAVCWFSSFWLPVFGKRRFFKVLGYRSFALSSPIQVDTINNPKHREHGTWFTQFLAANLQCDCCCLQWPCFSIFVALNRGLLTFSHYGWGCPTRRRRGHYAWWMQL